MKRKNIETENKNGLVDERGWLELLEDELDANLQEDLQILLRNSQPDLRKLESLKRTRAAVKNSDEVAMPENGHFYQELHDRTMAAIENLDKKNQEDAKPPRSAKRSRPYYRSGKASWGFMVTSFTTSMILILAALNVLKQQPLKSSPNSADSDKQAQWTAGLGDKGARADAASIAFEARLAEASKGSLAENGLIEIAGDSDAVAEMMAKRLEYMPADRVKMIFKSLKN